MHDFWFTGVSGTPARNCRNTPSLLDGFVPNMSSACTFPTNPVVVVVREAKWWAPAPIQLPLSSSAPQLPEWSVLPAVPNQQDIDYHQYATHWWVEVLEILLVQIWFLWCDWWFLALRTTWQSTLSMCKAVVFAFDRLKSSLSTSRTLGSRGRLFCGKRSESKRSSWKHDSNSTCEGENCLKSMLQNWGPSGCIIIPWTAQLLRKMKIILEQISCKFPW